MTALYVVEKGGGVPDKTPVEQSEEMAATAFAAVRETFPDADERTVYAEDVVSAILDAAAETGVDSIAYRPREGGRITRMLSGDLSVELVTQADCPVVVLPQTTDDE